MSEAMNEAVRALSAEEAVELIGTHIATFVDGDGPDREAEDVELGRDTRLKVELISARWNEARKQVVQVSLKPIEVVVTEPASPLFISPAIQPSVEEAKKPQAEPVVGAQAPSLRRELSPETLKAIGARPVGKIAAAPSVSIAEERRDREAQMAARAAREAAQSRALVPVRKPEEEEAKAEPPGTLNPKAPLDNARKFVALRHWRSVEKVRSVCFWQGQFWEWKETHWRVVDSDTVRAKIYKFLDQAERELRRDCLVRFEPDNTAVNKTVDALRAEANLEPGFEMPGWFGECPVENIRELVACQNGLLYVPERRLLPHTPRFWSPNVLEFTYDPSARGPRFEQFLEEVWPGDEEAQQTLVEMIGLCLTDVTKYQKAYMFIGPKRGGRGTIGRLLQGFIGRENYIGSTMHGFSESFGMQSFIGKKVVVFSDARLDGVRRQSLSVIAERLLSITGEDVLDINRKYVGYWSGALTSRIVVFSNELLRFQDDSGALASRFITVKMKQTFWGKEDPDLTRKLLAERSGILNMALDALDRLREREPQRLIQPSSGLEMSEDLTRLTSDVLAFVEDCCVIDYETSVTVEKLFARWETWCGSRKVRHGWAKQQFSEKVRAACPTVTTSRPRKNNPGRLTTLIGIGLRPAKALTLTKAGASA